MTDMPERGSPKPNKDIVDHSSAVAFTTANRNLRAALGEVVKASIKEERRVREEVHKLFSPKARGELLTKMFRARFAALEIAEATHDVIYPHARDTINFFWPANAVKEASEAGGAPESSASDGATGQGDGPDGTETTPSDGDSPPPTSV